MDQRRRPARRRIYGDGRAEKLIGQLRGTVRAIGCKSVHAPEHRAATQNKRVAPLPIPSRAVLVAYLRRGWQCPHVARRIRNFVLIPRRRIRRIQYVKFIRGERQREGDGVLLYVFCGAGLRNCDDIPTADGPGQGDRGRRAIMCGADT